MSTLRNTVEVLYLTRQAREQLIAELADRQAEITGRLRLEVMLRQGWRGYNQFTDTELVTEARKQGVDLPEGVTSQEHPAREYRVTWTIEGICAAHPRQAAEAARACMEPQSNALVFDCTCLASGETNTVDLQDSLPLELRFTPAQIRAMATNRPGAY